MVEPATTAATTAPREPRPSYRALRAIGAQPMHFKGLGLGVKAQFTRGLVQQIDHLLVFQFHRVVATVANQEWHRMLRGAWMTIGRASWRERVGKYVEISVVAVAV